MPCATQEVLHRPQKCGRWHSFSPVPNQFMSADYRLCTDRIRSRRTDYSSGTLGVLLHVQNRRAQVAVRVAGWFSLHCDEAGAQFASARAFLCETLQFDETFKTDIYAPFWITQATLPHLKPGATIINTASVTAYDPPESIIDYAATKGAIMIFTKGLAKQLAKQGIRVNAVAPGPSLDAFAGDNWPITREVAAVWIGYPDGSSGTTCRARRYLCAPGFE